MNNNDTNKTHWWTWVQFIFLIISICVSVVLWFKNERYKDNINTASYNEKAWEAISIFTKRISTLNEETDQKIEEILNETISSYDEWFDKIRKLETSWKHNASHIVVELSSKVNSYQKVVNRKLIARDYALLNVMNIRNPFWRIINYIDGKISERKIWIKEHSSSRGAGYMAMNNRKMVKFREDFAQQLDYSHDDIKMIWKSYKYEVNIFQEK